MRAPKELKSDAVRELEMGLVRELAKTFTGWLRRRRARKAKAAGLEVEPETDDGA